MTDTCNCDSCDCGEKKSPAEKIESLKKAISDLGFEVSEGEKEGEIRIDKVA